MRGEEPQRADHVVFLGRRQEEHELDVVREGGGQPARQLAQERDRSRGVDGGRRTAPAWSTPPGEASPLESVARQRSATAAIPPETATHTEGPRSSRTPVAAV